jgi:prepilin-type N-terminal cleavage/methylation domain-containing protein
MTPKGRPLVDQLGFTLAELLAAMAVISLVMAGVFAIQRGSQHAYLLGSNRVETQQNARVALDLMTRELRSATSIRSITPDVCFVDQYGQTIKYELSGSILNRYDNGTTCDNGTSTPLIGGVQSLTLRYYDRSTTLYAGTDPNQIVVIKIRLVTKTEETVAPNSPGDQRATMESTVQLRNLS